jgi:hypothetical protein
MLGPADGTHGIARPFQRVVADPNPGPWGGSGTLLDIRGEIGPVSMSVVLVPFPNPKRRRISRFQPADRAARFALKALRRCLR